MTTYQGLMLRTAGAMTQVSENAVLSPWTWQRVGGGHQQCTIRHMCSLPSPHVPANRPTRRRRWHPQRQHSTAGRPTAVCDRLAADSPAVEVTEAVRSAHSGTAGSDRRRPVEIGHHRGYATEHYCFY